MFEVREYVAPSGKSVFAEWLRRIRDERTRIAIGRRVARMELGNFGDHKFCRDGVWELRIQLGPGFRVYYGLQGSTVVILLCGGDKSTQRADIDRACEFWKDVVERST